MCVVTGAAGAFRDWTYPYRITRATRRYCNPPFFVSHSIRSLIIMFRPFSLGTPTPSRESGPTYVFDMRAPLLPASSACSRPGPSGGNPVLPAHLQPAGSTCSRFDPSGGNPVFPAHLQPAGSTCSRSDLSGSNPVLPAHEAYPRFSALGTPSLACDGDGDRSGLWPLGRPLLPPAGAGHPTVNPGDTVRRFPSAPYGQSGLPVGQPSPPASHSSGVFGAGGLAAVSFAESGVGSSQGRLWHLTPNGVSSSFPPGGRLTNHPPPPAYSSGVGAGAPATVLPMGSGAGQPYGQFWSPATGGLSVASASTTQPSSFPLGVEVGLGAHRGAAAVSHPSPYAAFQASSGASFPSGANPGVDVGQSCVPSRPAATTPRRFRPWDDVSTHSVYESISPPDPPRLAESAHQRETDSVPDPEPPKLVDGESLPSILSFLADIDPSLVSVRVAPTGILSEPERLSKADRPSSEGELLAAQSSLLSSFFSALGQEIKGIEASGETEEDKRTTDPPKGPLSLGAQHLRCGQFLPAGVKKLRPFPKPTHPLALGPLPPQALRLSESDRGILASHEGKSMPHLTASLPDKVLVDWEEILRLGLESTSLSELLISTLYKDSIGALPVTLTPEQRSALILAISTATKSSLHSLSRSYHNVILARRDMVLAKAKSKMPSGEKDALRSLPLDQHALFGPEALKSPSLKEQTEPAKMMAGFASQIAQAIATSSRSPKPQGSGKKNAGHSGGNTPQKRQFSSPGKSSPGGKRFKTSQHNKGNNRSSKGGQPKQGAAKSRAHPQ